MDMDSISALLEALKRGDAGKGLDLPDDDTPGKPIAAKISILKAMPLGKPDDAGDDDGHALDLHGMDDARMGDVMGGDDPMAGIADRGDESSEDAQDNAKIVAGLQTMFPEVYDKLCRTVLGDSDHDADDMMMMMGDR